MEQSKYSDSFNQQLHQNPFQRGKTSEKKRNLNNYNKLSAQLPYSHGSLRRLSSSSSYARGSQTSLSTNNIETSDYEAHLLDFLLLGDDFFLYLARMELKCKFKKGKWVHPV